MLNYLIACSESSSSSSTSSSVGSGSGISISITYASGNAITASSNATVKFTLRDSAGLPVANAIIKLTTTLATLATASVLTDSDGNASVILTSGGTSGADSISATATAGGTTFSKTYGYQVDLTTVAKTSTLVLTLANSAGTTIDTVTDTVGGTLKATILDSSNAPVVGQVVTFVATKGTLSTTSAITDSSGVATVLLSPGTLSGAGTVTATATINSTAVSNSIAYTVTSSTASTIVPSLSIALTHSGTTTNFISAKAPGLVTVTLINTVTGNALAGQVVSLTADFGSVASTTTGLSTGLTDSSGKASFNLLATSDFGAGSIVASTTIIGTKVTVTTAIGYEVRPPSISMSFSSTSVTNSSSSTVTVTVKDAANNVLSGVPVVFSTSLGKLSPTSGIATTNNTGVATIVLQSNGTEGVDTLKAIATVDSVEVATTGKYNVSLTGNNSTIPKLSLSLTGVTSSSISATQEGTLTATLVKGDGTTAISGEIISFSVDNTSATIPILSGVTNANGKVTIALKAGDLLSANFVTASATVSGDTVTSVLNFDVVAPAIDFGNGTGAGFTAGALSVATNPLTDGSSTTITASFVDTNNANAIYTKQSIPVEFTSTCAVRGQATISSTIPSVSGLAKATYTPSNCNTDDLITATATFGGKTYTATAVVTVNTNSVASPNIALTLKDTSGNAITAIRVDLDGVVTATLTNDSGNPLPNKIVTFTTTLAALNPSSGSVLTNSSGVATISLLASDTVGATTLTAKVTEGEVVTTQTLNYSVDAPKIRIGNGSGAGFTESVLAVSNATVSAGGTTSFTANLVNASAALVSDIYTVLFTSNCAESNLATIDTNVKTTNGAAVATYQANGCTGSDIITATVTIGGQTFTAVKTITVSSDKVGSIQFISATPNNIALKGTGGVGRQEFSNVVFKVIGATGLPIANKTVSFSLNTQLGGITLLASSVTTNSLGEATAVVQSGSVSTPVRVTAQVDIGGGTIISSQSDQLTISTGLADQNSISISADITAPEGDVLGSKVVLTVTAADAFNHSVPDGTSVVVIAEGGAIQDAGNTCLTVDGKCSVTWVAQNPRPADNRVTILAYIIGNESFYDRNGNGVYDNGDAFDDLPEAYLDADETSALASGTWNGIIDATIASGYNPAYSTGLGFTTYDFSKAENFLDFNGDASYSSGDTKFNGVACSHTTNCPSSTAKFSGRFTHVRDSLVLIMAESTPKITITANNGTTLTTGSNYNFTIAIEDPKALCLNAGSTAREDQVNVSSCTTAIHQSAPTGSAIVVASDAGILAPVLITKIPNKRGREVFQVTVAPDDTNTAVVTADLSVVVTTPTGVITTNSLTLTDPIN